MSYVDGIVAAVPNDKREAFIAHAQTFARLFKEYGAERIVECWGSDVPDGKLTSFPMAVKCGPDETVIFSWVWWPSKEVRSAAWEKMMKDPRMQPEAMQMPFDGKRMIFGGFEPVVDV